MAYKNATPKSPVESKRFWGLVATATAYVMGRLLGFDVELPVLTDGATVAEALAVFGLILYAWGLSTAERSVSGFFSWLYSKLAPKS